jgi:hypothetical protein
MEQVVKPEIVALVVDKATGKPITNMRARVMKTAVRLENHYYSGEKWLERSNPHGRAAFTVNPGVYQVQVMAEHYSLGISEEIDTEDPNTVTIELTEGGAISGCVFSSGRPVAGAKILALTYAGGNRLSNRDEFVADTKAVESDISGNFMLENIPEGLETIKVIHKDHAPAIVRDIAVIEGQTSEEVFVELKDQAIVKGYVFDNKGKTIAGARIDYGQNRERVITGENTDFVVTDPDGHFMIGGLGQDSYFMARNRGSFTDGVVSRTIIPICGETTRVDFGGDGCSVMGTLVVDDVPVPDIKLSLRSKEFGKFLCYTTTDPNGDFVFTGLIEGEYDLRRVDDFNTILASVEVVDFYTALGTIGE